MSTEKRIAVVPGSYDPVTNGHLDIIKRAAGLFDEVVVAVVNQSVRKSKAMFSIDERLGFITGALAAEGITNVRAEPFYELVVSYARRIGATAIVKGLRQASDFEYEMQMGHLNRQQAEEIESIFVMASPQFAFLSSSWVKELARFDGRIDGLVPAPVQAALTARVAELRDDG
ncbi:Phosphopantetheine adenylyltransferase [Patulibacter medicamentivorans]|uniref:Phosphopantetheine adenylyltransferase n=1 Tax=Patulibacter medicamentivorans TaxID=1097667 RepID=H0E9R9_9ACTN|nr:pantetheine-phosphate adenylyltransferase [Patulibacter medicamentivorans]EHN09568.1 Phosphopantetheine adenylyltransferase [Patulibacter medicamentivorans]